MKAKRVNLNLHEDNEYEKATIEFLEKCGRKKGEVVSSIIYAFLDETDIDFSAISRADFQNFFRMYPLVKKASKNIPATPITISNVDNTEKKGQKKGAPIDQEAVDRGKSALAAFGI